MAKLRQISSLAVAVQCHFLHRFKSPAWDKIESSLCTYFQNFVLVLNWGPVPGSMNFNSSGHMLLGSEVLQITHVRFWGASILSTDQSKAFPQNRAWRSSEHNIWSEEKKFIDPSTGPRFETKILFWKYVYGSSAHEIRQTCG